MEKIISTLKKIAKTGDYFSNNNLKKIASRSMDRCSHCPVPICKKELNLVFCSQVRHLAILARKIDINSPTVCYDFLSWFKKEYLSKRYVKI